MPVMNVAKFEKFFRLAAGLDVDKGDLKKYNDWSRTSGTSRTWRRRSASSRRSNDW